MSQETLFKLLIVGESGVGKTCVILRFADNHFEENFAATIGVDFKVQKIEVENHPVKLQIWDSAGQTRFRNITASYYRLCNGIIIVYDITKRDTFSCLVEWIEEVRKHVPTAPIMIIGNKSDLEEQREVTYGEAKAFADERGFVFFETSAKNSTNIKEVFTEMSRKLLVEAERKPKTEKSNSINADNLEKKEEKGGCCIVA